MGFADRTGWSKRDNNPSSIILHAEKERGKEWNLLDMMTVEKQNARALTIANPSTRKHRKQVTVRRFGQQYL